jgi:hypothetical protein
LFITSHQNWDEESSDDHADPEVAYDDDEDENRGK